VLTYCKADRKKTSTVLACNLELNYSTIINELMQAFFGSDCVYCYMRGLPLPDLFLKARKCTECFKLKLNTYLALKVTFDKEHLGSFEFHMGR
jgi:hypothetical protein